MTYFFRFQIDVLDLIVKPEEKSDFKKYVKDFLDSADQEAIEKKYHINTLTNQGVKLKSYNILMWKTSWKSSETLGVRFKLLEEDDYNKIHNSDLKRYCKESLNYIEKKAFNLVSEISLSFRNLENHIEQNKPILIENDCNSIKEQLDELSWVYVLISDMMLNGEMMHESSMNEETTNLKYVILNIAEHTAVFCKKKDNDLEVSFADGFPESLKTYPKPVLLMVYSFIMLFNELTQNASIEVFCENETVHQENHIINLKFKVVMKRPRDEGMKPDILDGSMNATIGTSQMDSFLISSINKCIVTLGANMDVQVEKIKRNTFEVILIFFPTQKYF